MAAAKGSQGKKRQTKDGGTGPGKGAGGNGGNGSGGSGENGNGNGNGGRKGFFGKLALDILVRVVANAVSDGLGEFFGNEDFDIQPQDEPDDETDDGDII